MGRDSSGGRCWYCSVNTHVAVFWYREKFMGRIIILRCAVLRQELIAIGISCPPQLDNKRDV